MFDFCDISEETAHSSEFCAADGYLSSDFREFSYKQAFLSPYSTPFPSAKAIARL